MLRSREVNTRGIVIGRSSSGEGSVRAALYTEEFGFIWVLAKSAREERSKLRPHLQVGTIGYYTLVKGSYDWRVTGAVGTKNIYFELTGVDTAQKSATRVLSVVRQLMQGETPDPDTFNVLWKFLMSVTSIQEKDIPIAERLVLINILSHAGYVSETDLLNGVGEEYSIEFFDTLRPQEKKLTRIINKAFMASGLV